MWLNSMSRLKQVSVLILAAAVCVSPSQLRAGGYLAVDNTGQPYKWNAAIPIQLDLGPLGKLTKTQADAMTIDAVSQWMPPNVPGSTVNFQRGADLSEDHGDGAGSDPNNDAFTTTTDGITAVIYDQEGLIIEQLGAGQSDRIVGFAGPVIPGDFSPAVITEGIAVFNGKFIDGDIGVAVPNDLPDDDYKGVMIHEFGHMLNLDHAQAAIAFTETGFDVGSLGGPYSPRYPPDYRGVPTMFPFTLPGLDTLETDDKAWILDLYADSSTAAANSSISGTIQTFAGVPSNGINIIAYSADDPTTMITCVSGYTDADPVGAPTGNYKIPSLPAGSAWVLDAEPIVGIFTGGSSVGPLDPPAVMPGAPEFLNESAFESTTDGAGISTTFAIPTAAPSIDITNVNLRFSDINIGDPVAEVDSGVDPDTAQNVPVMPGRYVYVNGSADPAEPGAQDLGLLGVYGDFYRVDSPAGLELNQIFIASQGSVLDILVLEKRADAQHHIIASTASGFGAVSVSLYLDSSRMSEGAAKGTYYFAVGFTDPLVGGSNPPVTSDYTLGLLFSVSDRDGLVVGGTQTGAVNPETGTVRILGRGFKNLGGAPTVDFSAPGIQVNGVTFVDENTLDVAISKGPGFSPGSTVIQVTNQILSGSYGGRITEPTAGDPSAVADWELY